MKLLTQPEDGVGPLLSAIKGAKKSVEIAIFRFDQTEIRAALEGAARRGVFVHALIAYTNKGGEKHLRKLEKGFLNAGVTVARTANDLIRYHDKFMIVDRHVLYLLSFNFTHLDIDRSRGFGIVTKNRKFVQEAVKLFEADTKRQSYTAGLDTFVVSPVNARKSLSDFIQHAKKQLLIYDPEIADAQIIRLLEERAKAGVEIKILGKLTVRGGSLKAHNLTKCRLHTRTIIRDRRRAFVGSQSLRQAELESRREVGMIVHDAKIVSSITRTFESDWVEMEQTAALRAAKGPEETSKTRKLVKKAVKGLLKDQPHLAPIVQEAVVQVIAMAGNEDMSHKEVQESVKEAVEDAVKTEKVQEAIRDAIQEAVQNPK